MKRIKGIKCLILSAVLLISSCTYKEEYIYGVPCQGEGCERAEDACSFKGMTAVNRSGLKYCPNNRHCTQEPLLPPEPCAQPMPSYYGNVSSEQIAAGILLIHPVTRTEVLCFDYNGVSASECAENFRASGYVLVTDLPQLPAKYDELRINTYPTRRWRNGGEVVPRW